jgi:hypothetical protein
VAQAGAFLIERTSHTLPRSGTDFISPISQSAGSAIRNPKLLCYSIHSVLENLGGSQWLTNRNSARTLCVPVHHNLTANIVVRHVKVRAKQLNLIVIAVTMSAVEIFSF